MTNQLDAVTTDLTTRSVPVGDLRFDALVGGDPDDPTVLFLHGFPQPASCWEPTMSALQERGFHVVAPTQRGYSANARPRSTGAYQLDCLVDDVVGLADALEARTFHLVGHDWGGVVAWALAARHPERLRSLTVVSTPHPRALVRSLPGMQMLRSSYALFFVTPLVSELVLSAGGGRVLERLLMQSGLDVERARAYGGSMGTREAMRAALSWYRATNPIELATVGPVDVPTLFVWGDADPALGRRAAERTGDDVLGDYQFEVLEGAGHWIPEHHADELVPMIAAHLERFDRGE